MYVPYRLRYGPFRYGFYFICVNMYSLVINVVAKEGCLRLKEGTFFKFAIKFVLLQTCQDLLYMLFMGLKVLAKDKYVV